VPDYSDLYNSAVPVLPPNQPYNPQNFLPGGFTPPQNVGNSTNPYTPGSSNNRGFLGSSGAAFGPGAQQLSDLTSGNFNMYDAMDPTGLLSSLFGGGGNRPPAFQPYIRDGLVQSQPSGPGPSGTGFQNPTQVTNVPGAQQPWSTTDIQQANQIKVMQQLLPYYQDAINRNNLQAAMGNLNVSQATSPGYAQLMTQIFNQYGPQLNTIGNAINRQNALAQANTERQVMAGPGADLVNQAYGLSQVFDKPYYDTRAATAGRLQDLMSSIDLNAGLSGTERNEIGQGLSREGYARGTANAPSATETVGNAMRYGQAGYQRRVQQQSLLGSAINTASSFLPTAKSGVDVFQVATGRPSMPNQGASQFTGLNPTGNTNAGETISQGLMGNLNTLQGQAIQSSLGQQQIDLQKKDWADYLGQITGSLGSLTSSAGGIAALCWIAREVYGKDNPKWLLFRKWLITKAPKWFFKLYAKYGPKVAIYISNKPLLKTIIRAWMDKRICQQEMEITIPLEENLKLQFNQMIVF